MWPGTTGGSAGDPVLCEGELRSHGIYLSLRYI